LANLIDFDVEDGNEFEKIIDTLGKYEGVTAHIEISVGRQNKKLNVEAVKDTISALVKNRDCVSSAKVKIDNDDISGVYDLFDNLCQDEVRCLIEANGEIPYERLAIEMKKIMFDERVQNRIMNSIYRGK
jgi:hypothetical protein